MRWARNHISSQFYRKQALINKGTQTQLERPSYLLLEKKSNRRHQRTGGSQKPPEGHYTDLAVDIIDPTPMTFTGICKEGESNIDGIEE